MKAIVKIKNFTILCPICQAPLQTTDDGKFVVCKRTECKAHGDKYFKPIFQYDLTKAFDFIKEIIRD